VILISFSFWNLSKKQIIVVNVTFLNVNFCIFTTKAKKLCYFRENLLMTQSRRIKRMLWGLYLQDLLNIQMRRVNKTFSSQKLYFSSFVLNIKPTVFVKSCLWKSFHGLLTFTLETFRNEQFNYFWEKSITLKLLKRIQLNCGILKNRSIYH